MFALPALSLWYVATLLLQANPVRPRSLRLRCFCSLKLTGETQLMMPRGTRDDASSRIVASHLT